MSLWRVVGGGCVASEIGFENDQMFIQIGINPDFSVSRYLLIAVMVPVSRGAL
jgi:hypothetical protein